MWVTDEEIANIADCLGYTDVDTFERRFVRNVGHRKSLVEYPDGDCIFLDPEKRNCLVYGARPVQCRTWPFWTENIESPKAWNHVAKSCLGCNQGRVYTLEEIETRLKA